MEKISPSAIFVVEGDAPHHSLLAEIGYQLNIPVYCFQWGFHFDQIASWNKSQVAWVDENLDGFNGRASRDDWVAQASSLSGSSVGGVK